MISIYGNNLQKQFKEKYNHSPDNINIKVSSLRELISALESQFKGFSDLLKQYPKYMIRHGSNIKDSKAIELDEGDVIFDSENWYLIPYVEGDMDVVIFGILVADIVWFGVQLIVTYAISYLLAPSPPGSPDTKNASSAFLFDKPQNTSQAETPIPITYGDNYGGSIIVSSGSETLDLGNNRTTQILSTVHVISTGEIEGPANDDNWYKSTYLNGTPVMSDTGEMNFKNVTIEANVGTSDQSALTGFDPVESVTNVATEVTQAGGAISRTINDTEVDDVKITLRWASLFKTGDSGSMRYQNCDYRITVTPDNGGGVEQDVITTLVKYWEGYEYTEEEEDFGRVIKKTQAPFDVQKKIENISQYGVAPWLVKVYRVTQDHDQHPQIHSTFNWQLYTTQKNIKMRYPDTAVVGVKFDARDFPRIPSIIFKIKGQKILVPSNYDTTARIYVGIWDGETFKKEYSNNPAWVYYDILSHNRYGLGEYINASQIDKWALYSIGAYCDTSMSYKTQVRNDDGSYTSEEGTEPRFTFNGQIKDADQAYAVVTDIASNMQGYPIWVEQKASIVQDSPKDRNRGATPANVSNGWFAYQGTGNDKQTNIIKMSYHDMDNFGEANTVVFQDDASIEINGKNPVELIAIGCNSRSMAMRKAKYVNYTNTHQNDIVTFKGGLEWADTFPGEIVGIQDPNDADKDLSGRILSCDSTSCVIADKTIELEDGVTYTIYIQDSTNRVLIERELNNSPETTNTFTWATPLNDLPDNGNVFMLNTSDVPIRDFQIVNVKEEDGIEYQVSGVQYYPSKYDEIENGISVEAPVYANVDTGSVSPTSHITLQPYTHAQGDKDNLIYGIFLSWQASTDRRVTHYEVEVAFDAGTFVPLGTTSELSYDHIDLISGNYTYAVRAVAPDQASTWAYSNRIDITTEVTAPASPEGLEVEGGGTVFDGKHCVIDWLDSTGSNYIVQDTTGVYDTSLIDVGNVNIKRYKVEVYTTSDSLLRTEYTKSNIDTNYTYTYEKNHEDNSGSPLRSFKFKVYAVNFDDGESSPAILTVSNPAPDMSGQTPTLTSRFASILVEWNSVTDNDMAYYELIVDDVAVQTIAYPETDTEYNNVEYETNYSIRVKPYDLFGVGTQSQAETGTPLQMPSVNVDVELSQSITITDSDSNSAATLSKLYDRNTTTDGVSYTISGVDKYIDYEYEITNYFDRVGIWMSDSSAHIYIAYSNDAGSTWSYLKCDSGHVPDSNNELVDATNQADAKSNYWELNEGINIALFPNNRIANKVRIYMTGTWSQTIYELVPSRIIISELAAIESLSAISLNVGAVTGIEAEFTSDSGSKVKIFKDENVGLSAEDSSGDSVFEVMVDGPDDGDVTVGRYDTVGGARWDQSEGLYNVKGRLSNDVGASEYFGVLAEPLWTVDEILGDDSAAGIHSSNNTTWAEVADFGSLSIISYPNAYAFGIFTARLFSFDAGYIAYARLLEDAVEKVQLSHTGNWWAQKTGNYNVTKNSANYTVELKAAHNTSAPSAHMVDATFSRNWLITKILVPGD